MADRLVLHIGPRKTGTTYLQGTLWANRDVLAERGVFLPLTDHGAQLRAVSSVIGSRWATPTATDNWDSLAQEVLNRPGTAVVSSELLASAMTTHVARFVEAVEPVPVEVVLGVRDLARQLPSLWQQWVRANSEIPYDQWLADARDDAAGNFWMTQDPTRVIDRWTSVLPRSRVSVVVLPRSGAHPELLWQRFAAALGIDAAGLEVGPRSDNPALGFVESELLRRVNEAAAAATDPIDDYPKAARTQLIRGALRSGATRPITIPPEHHQWLVGRSRTLVSDLEGAGVRVVGELADLLLDEHEFASHQDVSVEEVADQAAQVIVRLLRAQQEQERRLRTRLRKSQTQATRLRHKLALRQEDAPTGRVHRHPPTDDPAAGNGLSGGR